MTAGLSFSPSFSLGDTAPESGKPFKWFSRVGDNEDPKLKLGENEKGRLQPAREKTNCKGCHDNEQLRSNPGLELANAFGVFQTEPPHEKEKDGRRFFPSI